MYDERGAAIVSGNLILASSVGLLQSPTSSVARGCESTLGQVGLSFVCVVCGLGPEGRGPAMWFSVNEYMLAASIHVSVQLRFESHLTQNAVLVAGTSSCSSIDQALRH